MPRLEELVGQFGRRLRSLEDFRSRAAPASAALTGVSSSSLRLAPGFIFCALKGHKTHGARFAAEAIEKKVAAVLLETPAPRECLGGLKKLASEHGVALWAAANLKDWLGELANWVYGDPSTKLDLIAVTGTSGKTTSCYLMESMAQAAGLRTGVLGTVSNRVAERLREASLTTPQPDEAIALMAEMVEARCDVCFMEATSQALDMGRLEDLEFNGAVFANLSRDHLDYHHTMESYFKVKAGLFFRLLDGSNKKKRFAAANGSDPWGARLLARLPSLRGVRRVGFGLLDGRRLGRWPVAARAVQVEFDGTHFELKIGSSFYPTRLRLIGRHNVFNALSAAAAGWAMGLAPKRIVEGLEALAFVPGRLERIDNNQGILVFVDYAHKPDALENVLETLRAVRGLKRLIVVMGCGGDRDPGKRPLMGEIATRLADVAVFTSDNPRSEDPEKILDAIEGGARRAGRSNFARQADRRLAIRLAFQDARPGDCVLVAGKGHETYQIFAGETIHFDDREVCREILISLPKIS